MLSIQKLKLHSKTYIKSSVAQGSTFLSIQKVIFSKEKYHIFIYHIFIWIHLPWDGFTRCMNACYVLTESRLTHVVKSLQTTKANFTDQAEKTYYDLVQSAKPFKL